MGGLRGECRIMLTTARLEAFSDAVIAVAITLLVLDIKVPEASSTSGLWHALGDRWPNYASYAVSFVVIGIIWANHHSLIDVVQRVNRPLALLNVILLLTIVLIPFSTALMARYLPHGGGLSHVAAAVYSLVFLLMSLGFAAVWLYASRGRRLVVPGFTDEELRQITRGFTAGLPLYGVAIGVAFLSAAACLVLHLLLAIYYALAARSSVRPPTAASG